MSIGDGSLFSFIGFWQVCGKAKPERVDSVKEVKVDFDSKTATVTFDSSMATSSDIGNASTDVGFPASELDDQ